MKIQCTLLVTEQFACIVKILTLLQTYFNAPEGDEPLALDMEGMGKGEIWINGQSIGRYWTAVASGTCDGCSYTGNFRPTKCHSGCGQATQRWYEHSVDII